MPLPVLWEYQEAVFSEVAPDVSSQPWEDAYASYLVALTICHLHYLDVLLTADAMEAADRQARSGATGSLMNSALTAIYSPANVQLSLPDAVYRGAERVAGDALATARKLRAPAAAVTQYRPRVFRASCQLVDLHAKRGSSRLPPFGLRCMCEFRADDVAETEEAPIEPYVAAWLHGHIEFPARRVLFKLGERRSG